MGNQERANACMASMNHKLCGAGAGFWPVVPLKRELLVWCKTHSLLVSFRAGCSRSPPREPDLDF